MGMVQIFTAIKAVCGLQGALLHFVEYILDIDQAAAFEVEMVSAAEELFHQHGYIKLVRVIAGKISFAYEGGYLWCRLAESGFIGHIGISDAVYGRGYFWDVDGSAVSVYGPYALDVLFGGLVGVDFV
jgi:hypothetical protein